MANGRALCGPCHFPSAVKLEDGTDGLLFNEDRGTIEFWFRPDWRGAWRPPYSKREYRTGDRVMLHLGRERYPEYPTSSNYSTLYLGYSAEDGSLAAKIGVAKANVAWVARALIRSAEEWVAGAWHHFAVVWERRAAEEKDSLRFYIDGKLVSGLRSAGHTERLRDDGRIRFSQHMPLSVQIGALNNGWNEANAAFATLRISRIPRYTADFTPPTGRFKLDSDTSALFTLDTLTHGEGMTQDGLKYRIPLTPGILSW